jgi:threonine aldolase
MGSLLAGNRDTIEKARRLRKMLGGGVRQGGVIAAAGLVALKHIPHLAQDHAKASKLAEGLGKLGFNTQKPETNILFVQVSNPKETFAKLESVGVRCLPVGNALRFITHRDLSDGDVDEALGRVRDISEQRD